MISPVSSTSSQQDQDGTSVTIIDDWGREVTLDKPAEKIVFGHIAAGEGILLAGGWDKVIGRDASLTDPVFYPNLDSIPAINGVNQPFNLDFEKITELHPDLVILQKYYSQREGFDEIAKTLEPEIRVVGLDFLEPESAESIRKLGVLLGTDDVVDEYVSFHDAVINSIKGKTESLTDEEKPFVFVEAGSLANDGISTYGEQASFWNNMCDIAGGINVASDLPGDRVKEVDLEWLTQQEINTIIAQCRNSIYPQSFGYQATDPIHASGMADGIIAKINNMDVLSHSDAVQSGNVYLQEGSLANNPKSFIGTAYLAKWLHPDLFADLDPEQIHQEYLTKFIGADYQLQDVGLFGYPKQV